MLLSLLPDFDQRSEHPVPARKTSGIVWQERYEGIAVVAYVGGKAIAGISGPWSNHFALTWWVPNPDAQLQIFETLEEAKQAVEERCENAPPAPVNVPAVRMPRPSWLARLFAGSRKRASEAAVPVALLRQRALREHDEDLDGLSFTAIS